MAYLCTGSFIGANDYRNLLFPDSHLQVHQEKTLGVYLGFDLTPLVAKADTEAKIAKNRVEFETRRMKVDNAEVSQQIEQLEEILTTIQSQIQAIEAEQSILVDPDYAVQLRRQAAETTDAYTQLVEKKREVEEEKNKVEAQLIKVTSYLHRVKQALEFGQSLYGIDIDRCPSCESEIELNRVTEERTTGNCRLCGKTHVIQWGSQQVKLTEDIKTYKTSKKEVNSSLKQLRADLSEIQQAIAAIEEARVGFSRQLRDLARQEQTGFATEMRDLLERRGNLQGQLEQLKSRTKESRADSLFVLEEQAAVLNETLTYLQSQRAIHDSEILKRLERETFDFARAFGVTNLSGIEIRPKGLGLVALQGKPVHFAALGISEALRVKIAFHLALLKLSVEQIGRHPRLLIIDAPASAEMDETTFNSILSAFDELCRAHELKVQLLIATTRPALEDICDSDKIEVLEANQAVF